MAGCCRWLHENEIWSIGGASDVARRLRDRIDPQTELAMGLVCPGPTPTARQKAILDYLVKAAPSTGARCAGNRMETGFDEGAKGAGIIGEFFKEQMGFILATAD